MKQYRGRRAGSHGAERRAEGSGHQVPAEQRKREHVRRMLPPCFHAGRALNAGGVCRGGQTGVDGQSIVSPHVSDAPADPWNRRAAAT